MVVAENTSSAAASGKTPSKSAAIPVADPMEFCKSFVRPKTIEEAIEMLSGAPGPALPIAGGTDLLLDLTQGRHDPVHTLVDITDINEMREISILNDCMTIGAAVPINQILKSEAVRNNAEALVEACALIAGPQVRNTATLGGNVAHALPAADGTIALLTLGAEVEVASLEGRRRLRMDQLFKGPGESALDISRELIVKFKLAKQASGQGSAFRRIMRPQGVALPILNLAVWLQRDGDAIGDIRIAVGPSGPTPRRAIKTENALRGKSMSPDTIKLGVTSLENESKFRTSKHRATSTYRFEMSGVLFNQALTAAWERTHR